jgi:hypothetical protein
MCKIEECDGKVISKGLCAKHYARQRRTGATDLARKRGRPADKGRAFYRNLFSDYSPRTFSRYVKAMDILERLAELSKQDTQALKAAAIKAASRPNGSMNISRLLEIAEGKAAMYIATHYSAKIPETHQSPNTAAP